MKELIDLLNKSTDVSYLLDTCFFIDAFKSDKVKRLVELCKNNRVGMSSFNLSEFINIHHHFDGELNHHIRGFFKENILFSVPVEVEPGDKAGEHAYVTGFDEEILKFIPDPSDAVLFTLAIKIHSDILTKDRHHMFTAAAENYSNKFKIKVMNEF
jgi:hypothetical protein